MSNITNELTLASKLKEVSERLTSATELVHAANQLAIKDNREKIISTICESDQYMKIFDSSLSFAQRADSVDVDIHDLSSSEKESLLHFFSLLDSALSDYINGGENPFKYTKKFKTNDTNGNDHFKYTFTVSDGKDTLIIPIIVVAFRDDNTDQCQESDYNSEELWILNGEKGTELTQLLLDLVGEAFVELACEIHFDAVYFPASIPEKDLSDAQDFIKFISSFEEPIELAYKKI